MPELDPLPFGKESVLKGPFHKALAPTPELEASLSWESIGCFLIFKIMISMFVGYYQA